MTTTPANREKWRGASVEERQRYMAQEMHIHHPSFVKAITEIKRRMRRCINENRGAAILFLVPSGAGKTHTLSFLKKRWSNQHSQTLTTIPVIAFDIPTNPTALSMGQALLRAMGETSCTLRKATHVLDRIVHLLPQVKTELILVDNLQDVPEKRGKKGILEIGGWFRRLIDDGKRLVVLLGTSAAKEIITSNSQLRRRAANRLEMDYFHFDEKGERAQFLRFLDEVNKALPLAETSGISTPDVAASIHFATFGIQDYIFQLLVEAVGIAVGDRREKIEVRDLEEAFRRIFQDAAKNINPFSGGSPRRPLTMEGEPFFDWYDSSNPPLKQRYIGSSSRMDSRKEG